MLRVLENTGADLALAPQDLPLDQILIEGLVLPALSACSRMNMMRRSRYALM